MHINFGITSLCFRFSTTKILWLYSITKTHLRLLVKNNTSLIGYLHKNTITIHNNSHCYLNSLVQCYSMVIFYIRYSEEMYWTHRSKKKKKCYLLYSSGSTTDVYLVSVYRGGHDMSFCTWKLSLLFHPNMKIKYNM